MVQTRESGDDVQVGETYLREDISREGDKWQSHDYWVLGNQFLSVNAKHSDHKHMTIGELGWLEF